MIKDIAETFDAGGVHGEKYMYSTETGRSFYISFLKQNSGRFQEKSGIFLVDFFVVLARNRKLMVSWLIF